VIVLCVNVCVNVGRGELQVCRVSEELISMISSGSDGIMRQCTCICVFRSVRIFMDTCMYMCICVHMLHTYTNGCVDVRMYLCIYIYMYIHRFTYIYINILIYIQIYVTHTYT